MSILSIANVGSVQAIYTFGNSRYNQISNSPVAPVSRIRKMMPLSGEREEQYAVLRSPSREEWEEGLVARQEERVRSAYEDMTEAAYNLQNPYEAARMSSEGILLAGMNVNVLA